ncbi:TetR/AcrR family transcriptional regulator [Gordonia desulfuricans]|uniref:TetR/AcrR family transcriptional regulator n=1 Tax=Gordonia desulfuricans TaxID=89051 RepID=A0A7K3LL47_9ACTN|nr:MULTISPECIES: TetR/AcrR family transcriptional regulator [Gordonia]EMP13974.1 TetR family transcriptional regulator [Gordonia sp. NB41Y]NDK88883.1 TetR/AcrR family transcriptional regulator [Gordonia desulfuricans]WLP88897.1 TetR/AcrR family transcriptional regulator [Gordonia sp. NB41Y]
MSTSTPPSGPRRTRPADRKRQLVDHATTLFAERGYQQVSVADIARAAGVTAPSVYRHFTDKLALLDAAVIAAVDDLESCTDRALAGGESMDRLVTRLCVLGAKRPESTSLWRSASQHLTDEQNREVVLRTREVLHRWAATIDTATGMGERNAIQIAWAMLSVAGSLAVHNSRLSTTRAQAELGVLVLRLVALQPSSAPPLTAPPQIGTSTRTRRDEILDAAADLFAERGYAGVGVDDIGAAVGITGPSVYKHFSSKLAILLGIGQRSGTRLEAGVMAAYAAVPNSAVRDDATEPGTQDPAALLARLVDSYVGVITSSPDLSVAFNNSYALAGQPAAGDLLDVQRRYVTRWIDLLGAAHPDLNRAQAAIAVHAALSIVNDAVRVRRGVNRPEFPATMAYLMKGILSV